MIEFKHVDKVYPNGTKGLSDINLTIDQGEFVAIIGLSGAGKSTLIRTINRMIDITGGQLIVDGTDVMSLSGKVMRRYRRKIGMIFQSYNLVTRATAIKNVLTSMVPDMPFWRVLLAFNFSFSSWRFFLSDNICFCPICILVFSSLNILQSLVNCL